MGASDIVILLMRLLSISVLPEYPIQQTCIASVFGYEDDGHKIDKCMKSLSIDEFAQAFPISLIGLATNFQPIDDPFNPVAYAACLHRDLRDTDLVVAHPTLPCNSRVYIYNVRNKKSVIARVGDRGPRHALIDLAPATTKALKANGWEKVVMVPLEH